MLPRRALIVRPIQTRTALERTTNDVDTLTLRVHRDRDADTSRVWRQRVDLLPRLAGIGRLEERRAVRRRRSIRHRRRATACAAESTTAALRRREHHMRHVERVLEIACAVHVLRL